MFYTVSRNSELLSQIALVSAWTHLGIEHSAGKKYVYPKRLTQMSRNNEYIAEGRWTRFSAPHCTYFR